MEEQKYTDLMTKLTFKDFPEEWSEIIKRCEVVGVNDLTHKNKQNAIEDRIAKLNHNENLKRVLAYEQEQE